MAFATRIELNMHQTTLFNVPAPKPPRKRKTAAQRRAERDRAFIEFDAENPEIFERLKTMALRLKERGFQHYGLRCLWEALRYDLSIETTGKQYKLCDHLPPYFARKIMAEVPELDGFFETRERK